MQGKGAACRRRTDQLQKEATIGTGPLTPWSKWFQQLVPVLGAGICELYRRGGGYSLLMLLSPACNHHVPLTTGSGPAISSQHMRATNTAVIDIYSHKDDR